MTSPDPSSPATERSSRLNWVAWVAVPIIVALVSLASAWITVTGGSIGRQDPPVPTNTLKITSGTSVPECSDISGEGSVTGYPQVVIFVQHAEGGPFYYEQPVEFDSAGTWVAHKVHIGTPTDDGIPYRVIVTGLTAEGWNTVSALRASDNSLPTLPGTKLAEQLVQRFPEAGTCYV